PRRRASAASPRTSSGEAARASARSSPDAHASSTARTAGALNDARHSRAPARTRASPASAAFTQARLAARAPLASFPSPARRCALVLRRKLAELLVSPLREQRVPQRLLREHRESARAVRPRLRVGIHRGGAAHERLDERRAIDRLRELAQREKRLFARRILRD